MQITDQELVGKYLAGDQTALEALVERHLQSIYNFALRQIGDKEGASDVSQEVFIKAWKNIKRYDKAQSFKTWIMAIARNSSIDWLRRRRHIRFSDLDNKYSEETFEEGLVDSEPLPDEVYEKGEAKGVIDILLAELSPDQRLAVILRHMDHYTFEEISEIAGKPVNTVKSHYRRALLIMRQRLIEMGSNAPIY
jgi:RNA polymerase sigma-70 factor (ECF subfamily)